MTQNQSKSNMEEMMDHVDRGASGMCRYRVAPVKHPEENLTTAAVKECYDHINDELFNA